MTEAADENVEFSNDFLSARQNPNPAIVRHHPQSEMTDDDNATRPSTQGFSGAIPARPLGHPCSTGTLANLAVSGTGPIYRLAGRFPVYAEPDLDAWAQERLSAPRRCTQDPQAA